MRINLIDNWKQCYKMWSVRLSSFGAALMGYFLYFPDSALWLWQMMPREIHALLPSNVAMFIAFVIFIGTAISRLVKQNKLHQKEPKDDAVK